MSAFNLPPGCSTRDIDRSAGAYDADCERCGYVFEARDLNEVGLCDGCVAETAAEDDPECGPDCTCPACVNERRFGDNPFAG